MGKDCIFARYDRAGVELFPRDADTILETMNTRRIPPYLLASAVLGLAAPLARAELRMGNDRFFGKGAGPYVISWRNVEPRSSRVTRNGMRLEPLRDYMFDPAMGMLSLSDPAKSSDVIEISYQYDTDKASKPGPVGGTLGLLSSQTGGLSLNYSFNPDGQGNQNLSGVGFNGQAMLGSATLSSNFMLDKAAGTAAGREAQNMQFGLKQDKGPFTYNLGYSRVGKNFTQADALKLLKGSEAMDLSGKFQFSNGGALTLKRATNVTPDAKKGTLNSSILSGGLDLNLGATSHFSALHERQSSDQGGTALDSAVDRLRLDQKLGASTAATIIQETVTNAKNGNSETVRATRLSATSDGAHGLKIETGLALTDSDKKGNARDMSLKVARGDGPLKMTAAFNDRKADAGDVSSHSLGLERLNGGLKWTATLVGGKTETSRAETAFLGVQRQAKAGLQWSAGFANYSGTGKSGTGTRFALSGVGGLGLTFSANRQDDFLAAGDRALTDVKMKLDGIKNVKIDGAFMENGMGQQPLEAKHLNIQATPTDAVKLVATHARDLNEKADTEVNKVVLETTPAKLMTVTASLVDQANAGTTAQTQGVAVSAAPTDKMKLTATYQDGTGSAGDTALRGATLAVTPVKDKISFSGSIQEQTKAAVDTQIAVLQADIKPNDVVSVSSFYKSRENSAAPEDINTLNAALTLKPNDTFSLTTTYSANPEEKDAILRLIRRGVSLKTHLGGLTFSGGYLSEQSLIDDAEGARAEFKLGWRVNKYSEFQGGFEQTVGAVRGYKPVLAYNMRYSANIGSDFNLLLEGDVVQRDNSVPEPDRQVVKATANLGIRF